MEPPQSVQVVEQEVEVVVGLMSVLRTYHILFLK
jgi:hypothetical protein